jgi:amino acid transporter
MAETTANLGGPPKLARVLGLPALVIYGIILVQPTAPMPLFGVASQKGGGHVVTTLLFAMVAMLFTAISYGRMAAAYPNAGSAYTYVGRELHPALGYLTGWGMFFDYIMNPIICVVWCSKAAGNFYNAIPFPGWVVFFALLFTLLNLRGIKASSRTNALVAVGLGVVILLFFHAAIRYLAGHSLEAAAWTRPFYDPKTFSWQAVSTGTSLAVLTYIGFDGISTLSEEVHNPRRNILLATVLTCLFTGIMGALQVYTAQLIWPDYTSYPDVDTAFSYVAGRAGGQWLFYVVNGALLVASIGSGMGAHLGAGRLLYGMGRDNAIPRSFFGVLNPRTHIPSNNIILVGIITLVGALCIKYDLGAELLNFGAFVAFMGVNAAAFFRYFVRNPEKKFWSFVPPVGGFVICFYIWLNLSKPALIAGFSWLAAGIIYGAWKTQGFKRTIEFAEVTEETPGKPQTLPE